MNQFFCQKNSAERYSKSIPKKFQSHQSNSTPGIARPRKSFFFINYFFLKYINLEKDKNLANYNILHPPQPKNIHVNIFHYFREITYLQKITFSSIT